MKIISSKVETIHAFREFNYSRANEWFGKQGKSLEALATSLYRDGYRVSEGPIGVVSVKGSELAQVGAEERASFIDGVAPDATFKVDDVVVSGLEYRNALPQGKPSDMVVFGTRRTMAIVLANVARAKKDLPLITEVPVIRFDFEIGSADHMAACIEENGRKGECQSGLSHIDIFEAVRKLYHANATDTQVRQCFKAGTGPRFLNLVTLAEKLDLVEQIRARYNAGEKVGEGVGQQEMRQLRAGFEEGKFTTEQVNECLFGSGRIKKGEFEIKGQAVKLPPMADRDAINLATDRTKINAVKYILTAVRDNDLARLGLLAEQAEAINAATAEWFK